MSIQHRIEFMISFRLLIKSITRHSERSEESQVFDNIKNEILTTVTAFPCSQRSHFTQDDGFCVFVNKLEFMIKSFSCP